LETNLAHGFLALLYLDFLYNWSIINPANIKACRKEFWSNMFRPTDKGVVYKMLVQALLLKNTLDLGFQKKI